MIFSFLTIEQCIKTSNFCSFKLLCLDVTCYLMQLQWLKVQAIFAKMQIKKLNQWNGIIYVTY